MGRIRWLIAGALLGVAGTFMSMKFHVVRADDGIHWIPKATAGMSDPYVDVRNFTLADWNDHRELTLAIVQAEKSHLLEDAAFSGLRQTMENVMQSLHRPAKGQP